MRLPWTWRRPPRRIIAAGPLTPGFVCTHGGHPPAVGIDGCCLLCGRTPSTSTRAETPPESPARVEAPNPRIAEIVADGGWWWCCDNCGAEFEWPGHCPECGLVPDGPEYWQPEQRAAS